MSAVSGSSAGDNPAGRPRQAQAAEAEPALLYSLVYVSRATLGGDAFALDRIVASAKRRNAGLGITGVLVHGGGLFFQWLEGARPQVQGLLERIRADTRHADLVVLNDQEEARERLFAHWDMELVTPADIREVLADARTAARDSASAQVLQALLQQLDAGTLGKAPGRPGAGQR